MTKMSPKEQEVSEEQEEELPSGAATALQSDCILPGQEEKTAAWEEDDDDFVITEDPEELGGSSAGSMEKPLPKRRFFRATGSPTYMVWEEFWERAEQKWPDVERPGVIDGRTAGRLKRDLIGGFKTGRQAKATAMVRLAVLDWEAIQDEVWKATKRGRCPSIEDVIDLRHDLVAYLETGCTSNQHRVSAYARRYLKPKDTESATGNGTASSLKHALKKRR